MGACCILALGASSEGGILAAWSRVCGVRVSSRKPWGVMEEGVKRLGERRTGVMEFSGQQAAAEFAKDGEGRAGARSFGERGHS